ncbi:hypothetical protein H5410_060514, partial [Solanum commersonii]
HTSILVDLVLAIYTPPISLNRFTGGSELGDTGTSPILSTSEDEADGSTMDSYYRQRKGKISPGRSSQGSSYGSITNSQSY